MNNKLGLSRTIPEPIKRQIRQRCGFGCCVCGIALIEYHHFDPEFTDALTHDPNYITLLCPTCHSKATGGIFSKEFIQESNENPKCKQDGFTKDLFYVGQDIIDFTLGSASFKELTIILYDKEPLISFHPAETPNGPLRLNAKLYDSNGKSLLQIIDNEWVVGVEHFDVETKSNRLIIREKSGEIKLKLSHIAGKELIIEKIEMMYCNFKIQVLKGQFIVENPSGGKLFLNCPNIFATLKLSSNGSISL